MADPQIMNEAESPRDALEEGRLSGSFVGSVVAAIEAEDFEGARALVAPLHPADIADLFALVPETTRGLLAMAIGDALDAAVIAELDDYVRDDVLAEMSAREVAEVMTRLDTDDAVAIIEDMEADEQREVLDALAPADRADIEAALTFPEESAGRLMQRELVAVPETMSIAEVVAHVRAVTDPATDFWEIFVVDPARRPVGTIRLSWLLTTPPEIAVADIMQREQTLIPVDMDQEEVALQFQKYALISAAVVDGGGRLVGVITVDDVVHIIQQEAGEDVLKLSGAGDGDINEPVFSTYRTRSRWLVTNLATGIISATIIGLFSDSIEALVALAALSPIVASVGGNAGNQTMAVTVRALATNQLTEANTRRTIWREIRVALLNGLTLAALMAMGTTAFFGNAVLGGVIAFAMLFNIVIAGLAGVMVPLTLERFDADPAVASSVFVTMITDSMGFFLFLGLATLVGVEYLG
ncbi:magnesium transporter [Polymorphobacter multimanifer]|uniref:Magnesium transporter MgtE n=1 Tax=Polymorphobacter multimanifer TaxID=1070431 RepID=A0A841L7G9_9SPHN|nr:magnesium transporter [Polymorphobacter multimanifer]MBB6226893.1 magnesium transporter [Polymorphobacter multimanifer]